MYIVMTSLRGYSPIKTLVVMTYGFTLNTLYVGYTIVMES